jgi:hypothetical protein
MDNNQEELFIFIADISGYTNFMLSNQMAYSHGILAITELMESLVKQIDLPLKISKLEGDAILFYLLKKDVNVREDLGGKLLQLISLFSKKVAQMKADNACSCGGCANIDKLDLKIIVHFGQASIVSIGTFSELTGVDVILPHRLLKNHAKGHRYILLTEQASQQISLPKEMNVVRQNEEVADMGIVPVTICYPSIEGTESQEHKKSPFRDLKSHLKLFVGGMKLKLGIIKPGPFRNLPPSP